MPSKTDLLKLKRDIGTATPAELAELDRALSESEARLRESTALIGDGGKLAVPALGVMPSTWDMRNGGNAAAEIEWERRFTDARHTPLIVDPDEAPPDFMGTK